MKITYDPEAKAVYVQILGPGKYFKTIPQNKGDINIDYNTAMEITGIEILNVEAEPTIERRGGNMKKWYERRREALIVFFWGWGMFALGYILSEFVF